MKVIYNNIIPFKGFKAINLFGIIFARKDAKITKKVLNHEAIHTAQMKELWYIPFYIIYLIEWIYNITKGMNRLDAYNNISFEREAYIYENKPSYLSKRNKFAWYDFV